MVQERGRHATRVHVSLTRTGFIPLPPGRERGFDHADVWLGDVPRMFVAHTGADRVDVIDCETQSFMRSIDDLPGVAGVLIDREHDLLVTSDRACARVSVFRCSDEVLLGRIDVGPHPNGLAYDSKRRCIYSFNLGEPLGEGCTASVIHVDSMSVIGEIALPGRPRWAAYDAASDIVHANIRDPALIVRIDPADAAIVGSINVPAAGPHGLWIDGDRIYCAADGSTLVVIDRESGNVEASLPLSGVPDVVWLDARGKRLYVAVGDPGTVTVIDTAGVTEVETVTTESGAHTLAWEPTGTTLYVFCPESCGAALYSGGESASH
jgi:DNA-binding beta-propeller fold protein YncE